MTMTMTCTQTYLYAGWWGWKMPSFSLASTKQVTRRWRGKESMCHAHSARPSVMCRVRRTWTVQTNTLWERRAGSWIRLCMTNKTCPHLVLPGLGAGPQHGVLGTLDIFPVRLKLLSHAGPGVRVPLEQLRRLHHDHHHAEHSPSFTVAGDSPCRKYLVVLSQLINKDFQQEEGPRSRGVHWAMRNFTKVS